MTTEQLIITNINIETKGASLSDPAFQARMVRQTGVILGDLTVTQLEVNNALAKRNRIKNRGYGESVTFAIPGGEVWTPFDQACLAAGKYSY
jgi:hypothetical protein